LQLLAVRRNNLALPVQKCYPQAANRGIATHRSRARANPAAASATFFPGITL
jgi:hypothetical protein